MAEFFDYFKVIMDYLKTNKWLLLWIGAGLTGTGVQTLNVVEAKVTGEKHVHQVATAFQQQLEEKEEVRTSSKSKTIIIKQECTKCLSEVRKLREEFH